MYVNLVFASELVVEWYRPLLYEVSKGHGDLDWSMDWDQCCLQERSWMKMIIWIDIMAPLTTLCIIDTLEIVTVAWID